MVPVVLNSSCEACRASKVKCSGQRPCERCSGKSFKCVYNPRKKRGKPRDKEMKDDLSSAGCCPGEAQLRLPTPPSFNVDQYTAGNDFLNFCFNNGFPIKFINNLLRSGISTFELAAEIPENELLERFGPLPCEQLMKWRSKIQSVNTGFLQKPSFSDSQCAQFLSGLAQTGASFLKSSNPNTFLSPAKNTEIINFSNQLQQFQKPCPLQALYNTFVCGKKRKPIEDEEKESEELVKKCPKLEIKEKMQVCDWLVSLLGKLCAIKSVVKKEEPAQNQNVKDLANCLEDIMLKIENQGGESTIHSVEDEQVALSELKKKTLGLLESQFNNLKTSME